MKRKKRKYTKRKVSSPESDSPVPVATESPQVCPLCDGKGYRELDKAGLIRVRCKCRK